MYPSGNLLSYTCEIPRSEPSLMSVVANIPKPSILLSLIVIKSGSGLHSFLLAIAIQILLSI